VALDAGDEGVLITREVYQPLDQAGLDKGQVAGRDKAAVMPSGFEATVDTGERAVVGEEIGDRTQAWAVRTGDQDFGDMSLDGSDYPVQEKGCLVCAEAAALAAGEDDAANRQSLKP